MITLALAIGFIRTPQWLPNKGGTFAHCSECCKRTTRPTSKTQLLLLQISPWLLKKKTTKSSNSHQNLNKKKHFFSLSFIYEPWKKRQVSISANFSLFHLSVVQEGLLLVFALCIFRSQRNSLPASWPTSVQRRFRRKRCFWSWDLASANSATASASSSCS